MSTAVLPQGWKRPAGFSEGRSVEPGTTIVVAGQLGLTQGDGSPAEAADFAAQWALALARVADVVRAAGGGAEDVVSLRIYVTDLDEYRAAGRDLGPGWGAVFGKHFPAMTMVEVSGLLEPEAKIEIEAVAVVGAGS
jgi:enamine deaminase RidA (YjgF/YER057c/UK114 family)